MSGGARDGAALEETGRRLGDVLRRALRDRLARRRDGVSTDADDWPADRQPVEGQPAEGWSSDGWSSDSPGFGEGDGGDAGQVRSDNTRDAPGAPGLSAFPFAGGTGGLGRARDRGERT